MMAHLVARDFCLMTILSVRAAVSSGPSLEDVDVVPMHAVSLLQLGAARLQRQDEWPPSPSTQADLSSLTGPTTSAAEAVPYAADRLLEQSGKLASLVSVEFSGWGLSERPLIENASLEMAPWGQQGPECLEDGSELKVDAKPHVFVLVPGFGNEKHTPQLLENIRWLRRQDAHVTCLIYLYSDRIALPEVEEFLPCKLVHSEGMWTSFVKRIPEKFWQASDYVLLWLDDVVPLDGVDLRIMTQTAQLNGLSVLSPSYDKSESSRWPVMVQSPELSAGVDDAVGRRTDFVEWQMTLMRPSSFSCLRKMIDSNNPAGWGLDLYFSSMCPGHCIGVLDSMTMNDTSSGSYSMDIARIQMNQWERTYPAVLGKHNLGILLGLNGVLNNSSVLGGI